MFRIDNSSAVSSLPTPQAAGTQGYFTNGDPVGGVEATIVEADFLNMIQEELSGVVEASGQALNKTNRGQLLAALMKLCSPIVGTSRNLRLQTTSGTALTATADQIAVGNSAGTSAHIVTAVNHTFNAATSGLNGMDTGGLPATGVVAVYEIFNPSTGAKGLLGQALASIATVAADTYAGANPVAGYTESALVAVIRTASSAFIKTTVVGRKHLTGLGTVFGTTAVTITPSIAVLGAVPGNAKSISGYMVAQATSANADRQFTMYAASTSEGAVEAGGSSPVASGQIVAPAIIDLFTPQTAYYTLTVSTGGVNVNYTCSGYAI